MKCEVMGIVNVTPDSFSDGGQFYKPEEAVRRARNLAEEGARIIDLGGESTRPGSTPLTWDEEWARLEPVLDCLQAEPWGGTETPPLLSVDTYHPETAERAVARGVTIVNCVYPEPAEEMARICAKSGAELVIPYRLEGAGSVDLEALVKILPLERMYLDPMIGFGTTRLEDVVLLRSVSEMAKVGRVLVGASRKRLVKKLTGEKVTGKNLGGNVGIAVWSALKGAAVVRVHDVRETVQALKVIDVLG